MVKGSVLQIGRSLVRSQLVSLEFFIDVKSLRSRYGHAVDSASNRNEYQKHFLGIKAAGAYGCAVVMKSGNLNFLELSGPLRASNGTALPLPLNTNEIRRKQLLMLSVFELSSKQQIYFWNFVQVTGMRHIKERIFNRRCKILHCCKTQNKRANAKVNI